MYITLSYHNNTTRMATIHTFKTDAELINFVNAPHRTMTAVYKVDESTSSTAQLISYPADMRIKPSPQPTPGVAALVELLKLVEWEIGPFANKYCRICECNEKAGHAPDCKLDAFLSTHT